MAKQSQIDQALASLKAERDVLDLAIRKLEAQVAAKPTVKTPKRSSRRRDNGEGATTDSGNMAYPPA